MVQRDDGTHTANAEEVLALQPANVLPMSYMVKS